MTENSESFSATVVRVGQVARTCLARHSNQPVETCQESVLFHEDQFVGLRFYSGHFRADWRIGDTELQIFRQRTPIGTVSLNPESSRRAA